MRRLLVTPDAIRRSRLFLPLLLASIYLAAPPPASRAAFIVSGNIDPANLANWNSSTACYVGMDTYGSLTVNADSDLTSRCGSISFTKGVTGVVTIDGAGSTWTNKNYLYVGESGNGTLNITGGGSVSSGYLYVGNSGSGALNITGGGTVSNSAG